MIINGADAEVVISARDCAPPGHKVTATIEILSWLAYWLVDMIALICSDSLSRDCV